jgi:hypothetical protein
MAALVGGLIFSLTLLVPVWIVQSGKYESSSRRIRV